MLPSDRGRSSANLGQNRRRATYELKFSSDEKGVTLLVVVLADQGGKWLSWRQLQKHYPDLSVGVGLLAAAVLFLLVTCLVVRGIMWLA